MSDTKESFKSIVAGIDSSLACDQALKEADRIARWNGSHLTAVNVLDQSVLDRLNRENAALASKLTSQCEAGVKAHIDVLLGSPHTARLEFTVGDPFTELQKSVTYHKADLLVLGSGHEPGHIGAVASKSVRRSHCDVLLVKESQASGFRKVVACVDFSEVSKQAAQRAYQIAKQDGARLELLHVCPTVEMQGRSPYFIPILSEMDPGSNDAGLEDARKKLDAFAKALTPDGTDVSTTTLCESHYKKAILDHVRTSGVDLVVMGKRGKTNLRSILLGTTAERVINHADCSVLLVHPTD